MAFIEVKTPARLSPYLNSLGETSYELTVSENSGNLELSSKLHFSVGQHQWKYLTASVLYFYLDDKAVGCPEQALTFSMKISCPNKQLLFDYSRSFDLDFDNLTPENYGLLGYYRNQLARI